MDISMVIMILGVLVALTNVVVSVLKGLFSELPTNILAVIVGIILTIAAGVAYFQINGLMIYWYTVVAMIVVGFMVAYAAMFGFDKLKEAMSWKDEK